MNDQFLNTALILPFELLLPVLGVLLIRSESPINSLIYRSFLGSISALIYAIIGAPDVALTEVMVGTLLSSLIYIVTIRSCYSIIILVDQASPLEKATKAALKSVFDELHLRVVYQEEDFASNNNHLSSLLHSKKFSGSPHAIVDKNSLYVEVQSLLDDIISTSAYDSLCRELSTNLIKNS